MLGEGAVADVLATELPAFLGPDAGADDFAGFVPDYHDGEGSVGLFGAEGPDEGIFGDPSPGMRCGRMRWVRMRWAWWGSLGIGLCGGESGRLFVW